MKTRESATRVYEVLSAQPYQVDSAAPLFAPGMLEVHFVDGVFTYTTLRASTADTRPGDLWADGLLIGDLPDWAKPLVRYQDG
jgi:hypothetical protein